MIIVIGASSFIGVYTVNALLEQGHQVLATGRNDVFRDYYDQLGVEYVSLDISSKESFDKLPEKGVEAVILLAALLPANSPVNLDVTENAADYFYVNTIGTINVLEYCRLNQVKRLISTTSYADVSQYWNKDKTIDEFVPRSFSYKGDHAAYVISKNAAADILEYYNQQHGMSNAIFRLPPVYGVGPHGSLYVNGTYVKSGLQLFIEKATNGEEICVFGDKDVSRDVVYVKDVAGAFVQAIQSPNTYGLYNITSGKGVTLEEQANVIMDIFGPENANKNIIFRPDIPNGSQSYIFSIERAGRDFDYSPQYGNFRDMMEDYFCEMQKGIMASLF